MSTHAGSKRLTVPDLVARKGKDPIVCLTSYHAHTAKLIGPHVDLLLVGDSLGMVMYGMETTLGVTLEMMIAHGAAVVRGSKKALVVIDLPFGTYEESPAHAFHNAARAIKETGAQAVKLEGGTRMEETVRHLTERGIPVMGHLGLLPQAVHNLGYRRQAKDPRSQERLLQQASELESAGCFAMVLEHVPPELAGRARRHLTIPVIGIGAGPDCDGC